MRLSSSDLPPGDLHSSMEIYTPDVGKGQLFFPCFPRMAPQCLFNQDKVIFSLLSLTGQLSPCEDLFILGEEKDFL